MGFEIIKNENNVVGIACSREKKNKCYVCGRPSTSLCDATKKDGKPCDLPMCDFHRNRIGGELDDVDVCHYHNYPKYIERAKVNREQLDEVMVYFYEEYQKQDVRVVPGHWPEFKTTKEVDEWINNLSKREVLFEELFKDNWICPVCENEERDKKANYCKICGTKIEKDTKHEVK